MTDTITRLYIEPVPEPIKNKTLSEVIRKFRQTYGSGDKMQKHVPDIHRLTRVEHPERCFRDPNNKWNLLSKLGLSWSVHCPTNSDSLLSGDNLRIFWEEVAFADLDIGNLNKAYQKYFRRKHQLLLVFLQQAIVTDRPILVTLLAN